MQSMGAVEKTVDREYDDEEKRYRSFENKVNRLAAEVKGTLDAIRGALSPFAGRASSLEGPLLNFLLVRSNYLVSKVVFRGH